MKQNSYLGLPGKRSSPLRHLHLWWGQCRGLFVLSWPLLRSKWWHTWWGNWNREKINRNRTTSCSSVFPNHNTKTHLKQQHLYNYHTFLSVIILKKTVVFVSETCVSCDRRVVFMVPVWWMMEHRPLEGIVFLCGALIDDGQDLDASGGSLLDVKCLHSPVFVSEFFVMNCI